MKRKSVLSVLLVMVMVFSMTATPAYAAAKPKTKTITFDAGTYEWGKLDSTVSIKVTNVTSQKTKDFSATLSDDDGTKTTFSGINSKVIYCKGKTTVTLTPNKGEDKAAYFGINMFYDSKVTEPKLKCKYYEFSWDTEEIGKKLDKQPDPDSDNWVIGDGTSYTISKPGTYVLYVRPLLFYGAEGEDFELNPVFIVVKK